MSRPFVTQNSGNEIYLDKLDENTYNIVDIANSLSNQGRWNGHTDCYFSVAQHCWLASQIAPKELQYDMLLHDAAESILSDIPRPIKSYIEGALEFDDKFSKDIAFKFGLTFPMTDQMKIVDDTVLMLEAKQLLTKVDTSKWGEYYNSLPLPDIKITPWRPEFAKSQFLDRYNFLLERKVMHAEELVDNIQGQYAVRK